MRKRLARLEWSGGHRPTDLWSGLAPPESGRRPFPRTYCRCARRSGNNNLTSWIHSDDLNSWFFVATFLKGNTELNSNLDNATPSLFRRDWSCSNLGTALMLRRLRMPLKASTVLIGYYDYHPVTKSLKIGSCDYSQMSNLFSRIISMWQLLACDFFFGRVPR